MKNFLPIRGLLIFWVFVIAAISYLDRVNISVAGQFLQKDFGLSNTELGWVFRSFVLGYALMQAPAGRLADRLGPRNVIALATLWWGFFTALTAAIPARIAGGLALLLGVRFLLGMGESIMFPGSNRLVASWIPSRERGIANGVIFAGVGIGAGIAPPLITAIIIGMGWRWSFWISAIIGLAAGAMWFALARDTPSEHPWIRPAEALLIRDGLPAASTARILSWRAIVSSRDVLLVSASYACYGYVAYIFFTWFFIYLNTVRGLDLRSSSFYSMLPFLAMAAGSPLGGWISDVLCRLHGKRVGRCAVGVTGLMLSAIFVACSTQVADARLASVVLAGGAGALYLSQSVFWAVTADLAGTSAGSVSGFMNMANQLAGTLTASLTPYIGSHYGWTSSFAVASALAALGALAWLFVDPNRTILVSHRN